MAWYDKEYPKEYVITETQKREDGYVWLVEWGVSKDGNRILSERRWEPYDCGIIYNDAFKRRQRRTTGRLL